eukprot:UN24509
MNHQTKSSPVLQPATLTRKHGVEPPSKSTDSSNAQYSPEKKLVNDDSFFEGEYPYEKSTSFSHISDEDKLLKLQSIYKPIGNLHITLHNLQYKECETYENRTSMKCALLQCHPDSPYWVEDLKPDTEMNINLDLKVYDITSDLRIFIYEGTEPLCIGQTCIPLQNLVRRITFLDLIGKPETFQIRLIPVKSNNNNPKFVYTPVYENIENTGFDDDEVGDLVLTMQLTMKNYPMNLYLKNRLPNTYSLIDNDKLKMMKFELLQYRLQYLIENKCNTLIVFKRLGWYWLVALFPFFEYLVYTMCFNYDVWVWPWIFFF